MKSDWDTANLCDERQCTSNFHIKPEKQENECDKKTAQQTRDGPYLNMLSNTAPNIQSVNINNANQLSDYFTCITQLSVYSKTE